MNVLAMYDGVSCGRVAFNRTDIKVNKYYASEIDKYAIQIAQKNYPDTIQIGDAYNIDYSKIKDIDIVIGGSPCTHWSIAKKDRETTSEGIGFDLFMQYVKAIEKTKPKYFLYENNYSIHKNIKEEITKKLGVEPIMINSALVSAQQRKRCYWTNISNITQPNDKGIVLKDILESGMAYQDKSYCLTASYNGAVLWNTLERKQRSMIFEPICLNVKEKVNVRKYEVDIESLKNILKSHKTISNKDIAEKLNVKITTVEHWFRNDHCFSIPDKDVWFDLKKLLNIKTNEFDKSITEFIEKDNVYEMADRIYLENGKGATLITKPYRIGQIGKGGQGDRIYSVKGKSVCLSANGGGRGAKTGLYKVNLPNGDYIVRKLTPIECERLQTLPDNYTEGISNTQRYKCIGNGWTVDVISHILSFIPNT